MSVKAGLVTVTSGNLCMKTSLIKVASAGNRTCFEISLIMVTFGRLLSMKTDWFNQGDLGKSVVFEDWFMKMISDEMMKLRIVCISYGTVRPEKYTSLRNKAGAPKFIIPKEILNNLLEDGFLISDIANLLSVSERTIYRRMDEYGVFYRHCRWRFRRLNYKCNYRVPFCRETLLRQILVKTNVKVQRSRLREILHHVDDNGIQDRRAGRLKRRVYNVQGVNHLWHIDTNHKLVRWNFIIAGGIDGFSRFTTFLKCIENNKAETVASCFLEGVNEFGLPLRVRSDKGMENSKVADFMIERRGANRGSMIVGKSVHNQRIERLWRDVFDGVLAYYYVLFYFMEDEGLLDPLDEIHMYSLHHVFMPKINEKLCIWREAWARHRLRTAKSSPIRLWLAGQMNNPIGTQNGCFLDST
ncbi:unnamed protein product [Mytilus edulis]|uniref:Integrase catalytic domain-containing protein n=1 Tax=Mytilus edulis TaxID=6550 RepID=A0A8S3RAL9_MYTED|nr:unnamed protein product [Mytilus edulis]